MSNDTTPLLDLRQGILEQLQDKLGEANAFMIDSEALRYPDLFIRIMNDLLQVAGKELPNAEAKMDDGFSVIMGNNSYKLHLADTSDPAYILDRQIIKDLNAILEAQQSTKRFFYFEDNYYDCEYSFFFTDKEPGLQFIDFLNDPPHYSENDFPNTNENRSIIMHFVDSTTEKKAAYFVQSIEDF